MHMAFARFENSSETIGHARRTPLGLLLQCRARGLPMGGRWCIYASPPAAKPGLGGEGDGRLPRLLHPPMVQLFCRPALGPPVRRSGRQPPVGSALVRRVTRRTCTSHRLLPPFRLSFYHQGSGDSPFQSNLRKPRNTCIGRLGGWGHCGRHVHRAISLLPPPPTPAHRGGAVALPAPPLGHCVPRPWANLSKAEEGLHTFQLVFPVSQPRASEQRARQARRQPDGIHIHAPVISPGWMAEFRGTLPR